MFKAVLGLAACAALLGGCAQPVARISGDVPPEKCRVGVFVNADGQVVVDSEPVHPRGCADGNAVTWQVRTAQYTFDSNGIAFGKAGTPTVACTPGAAGREYKCTFGLDRTGTFPYSIRVVGPNGPKSVDPSVIID